MRRHVVLWRLLVGFAVLSGLVMAYAAWRTWLAPTRIAVVNYTDMQYAQMLDANDNAFIRIDRLEPADLLDVNLASYDATLVFGMGLHLNEAQTEAVREYMREGARIYVAAQTSKESELTNLSREDLDHFNAYTRNGGRKNTQRLLNYVRREMDSKTLFSEPIEEAEEIPMDALFHLEEDAFFEDVVDYQRYYEEAGLYSKGKPRVCLLTSLVGPRTTNRSYVDGLIKRFEERGLNVYPVSGFLNRLSYLTEIAPDLAVYIPHGRLAMGQSAETVAWLREQNVPLLCPLDVFKPHDEWLKEQEGMMGGMLSQAIVMPELDGGIEPYVIAAQFPDERGLYVPGGISDRLDTFSDRVVNWLELKAKPNDEKKVAIVYYKGPGRNAMVAAGLEVAPSLLGVLRHLKAEGYDTGPLPETTEAFAEAIQRSGPVLGPYAKGAFDDFVETGNPELIPIEDYLAWVQAQLEPDLYAQVESAYGPAPGDYLSVVKDGNTYIALPRVRFGNVVLLPQLLPALGDDTSKLVHGVPKAPPHPYIATYLWARHGFEADALIHFGTHGSFEFTPWKQSALSQYDWADALIGDLPHPYIYVINNIGEAVIAKRRSYAAIVSHLTPPFMESELYGPLSELAQAVDGYRAGEKESLRAAFEADVLAGIEELDLHKDLGMDDYDGQLSDELVDKLHNYLHTIAQEKITRGLYTLGTPYPPEHARETARLMAVDPLSYSLAHLAKAKGKAVGEQAEDGNDEYQQAALSMIDKVLASEAQPEDFIQPADLERLAAWDEAHADNSEAAMLAAMRSMIKGDKDQTKPTAAGASPEYDEQRLRELLLDAASSREHLDFLKGLQSDAAFERTAVVLDPAELANARKLAEFIAPMREAMETMEVPSMLELLKLMHSSEAARKRVFELLEDPATLEELSPLQVEFCSN